MCFFYQTKTWRKLTIKTTFIIAEFEQVFVLFVLLIVTAFIVLSASQFSLDICFTRKSYFFGNKAKGKISKRWLRENEARHFFQKTNIFNPQICARFYACQGIRNNSFSENLVCFVFL